MITVYTLRWAVTLFVGIVFAGAGAAKVLGDPVFTSWFLDWGYPLELMRAIGVVEIACVVMLAIPQLASYAVLALLGVGLGAFAAQVTHGQYLAASLPALLAAGSAVLVWGTPGHPARIGAGYPKLLPDRDSVVPIPPAPNR